MRVISTALQQQLPQIFWKLMKQIIQYCVRMMSLNIILLLLSALLHCCHGFAFQLPKISMPWEATSSSTSTAVQSKKSPIKPNDKIVIFGATGGVGQLVTKKLSARTGKNYQLGIAARDAARAKETLLSSNTNDDDDQAADESKFDFVELNLVGDDKASEAQLQKAMEGATGIVVSVGTTAFPTKRWDGGNTPKAIDMEAVTRIANAASNVDTIRRMVLLTSVGVTRTNQMPFLILNLFLPKYDSNFVLFFLSAFLYAK